LEETTVAAGGCRFPLLCLHRSGAVKSLANVGE